MSYLLPESQRPAQCPIFNHQTPSTGPTVLQGGFGEEITWRNSCHMGSTFLGWGEADNTWCPDKQGKHKGLGRKPDREIKSV